MIIQLLLEKKHSIFTVEETFNFYWRRSIQNWYQIGTIQTVVEKNSSTFTRSNVLSQTISDHLWPVFPFVESCFLVSLFLCLGRKLRSSSVRAGISRNYTECLYAFSGTLITITSPLVVDWGSSKFPVGVLPERGLFPPVSLEISTSLTTPSISPSSLSPSSMLFLERAPSSSFSWSPSSSSKAFPLWCIGHPPVQLTLRIRWSWTIVDTTQLGNIIRHSSLLTGRKRTPYRKSKWKDGKGALL